MTQSLSRHCISGGRLVRPVRTASPDPPARPPWDLPPEGSCTCTCRTLIKASNATRCQKERGFNGKTCGQEGSWEEMRLLVTPLKASGLGCGETGNPAYRHSQVGFGGGGGSVAASQGRPAERRRGYAQAATACRTQCNAFGKDGLRPNAMLLAMRQGAGAEGDIRVSDLHGTEHRYGSEHVTYMCV
eukprot:357473-Chlamydomonas_euryale.AAC.2